MANIAYIARLVNKETGESYSGAFEAPADIVAATSAAIEAFAENHTIVVIYPEDHQDRLWFDSDKVSEILKNKQ